MACRIGALDWIAFDVGISRETPHIKAAVGEYCVRAGKLRGDLIVVPSSVVIETAGRVCDLAYEPAVG
jgi:hypothetical protein